MARKVLFFTFIYLGVVSSSETIITDICPSYELIYPCFCGFMPKYDAEFECQNNTSLNRSCQSSVITCFGDGITSLKKIFNKMVHYTQKNAAPSFEWLYLVDPKLDSLENNLFGNVYFENIYLQNCPRLRFINENAFGNESRLHVKKIYVNATMLSDHPRLRRKTFKALSGLKNLDTLEIQNSNLKTIPVKAFNRFTNVKIIRFYNPEVRQKLMKISSKSFYRATQIEEIDLKNNQISHISSYSFHFQKKSSHEVRIWLSGNSLHSDSFEPNAFDGGNGRKMIIYLGDYNNCNLLLTTLKQNVFESFLLENKNNMIDMYGCPLVCDQKMDWLINGEKFKNQIRNLVCYSKPSNVIDTDRYAYHVSP